jgi:hypothetical protein
MGTRYDHPNTIVRREAIGQGEAGGGATTEYAKFSNFQKMKLKKAHAVVTTAGTSAAHGFDVFNGTTSIGTISLGTSAALSGASSGALDSAVAALGQISVKSLTDVVGKATVVYEYEVEADSVQS